MNPAVAMNDDEHNSAPSFIALLDWQKSALYQSLLWIDPLHETLTPTHLTKAYDLLWETISMQQFPKDENDGDDDNDGDDHDVAFSLHPRQQQATQVLSVSSSPLLPSTMLDSSSSQLLLDDWIDVHCDLIRAMVVTCCLLLEIAPRMPPDDLEDQYSNNNNSNNNKACFHHDRDNPMNDDDNEDVETLYLSTDDVKVLQQTMERCYSLLTLLKKSSFSSSTLQPSSSLLLSSSHYPFLQGAMEGPDPWIPRSKQERQCWSIELETSRIFDQRHSSNEASAVNQDVLDEAQDMILQLDLDPSSLREDEKTLIQMANRPIPKCVPPERVLLGLSTSVQSKSHDNGQSQLSEHNQLQSNNDLIYHYYLWPRCGIIQAVSPFASSSTSTLVTPSFRPGKMDHPEASSNPSFDCNSSSSPLLWAITPQTTLEPGSPLCDNNDMLVPESVNHKGKAGNKLAQRHSRAVNGSGGGGGGGGDFHPSSAPLCITNLLPLAHVLDGGGCDGGDNQQQQQQQQQQRKVAPLVTLAVTIPTESCSVNGVRKLEHVVREIAKQRSVHKTLRKEWATTDEYEVRRQQVRALWNRITRHGQQDH